MSASAHVFISHDAYTQIALNAVSLRLQAIASAAAGHDLVTLGQVLSAEIRIHEDAHAHRGPGVTIPILWLRERLGLSVTEELVLWTLLAHELDAGCRQALRELNTENVADVTLDTLRRVVYGDASRARAGIELSAEGPLRRLELIVRTDGDTRCTSHRQTFTVSARVLSLALGSPAIDPALADLMAASQLPVTHGLMVDRAASDLVSAALTGAHGLVVVTGRQGAGRRSLLVAAAAAHGHDVSCLDGRSVANTVEDARRQLRTFARECALLAQIPLICHLDALGAAGDVPDRIGLVETELQGLVLATSVRPISRRWLHAPTVIELPATTNAERAQLWMAALPVIGDEDAALLATMYPLAPGLVVAAGEAARRAAGQAPLQAEHIATAVRSILDDRLAGLATRMTITQSWEDLVVPQDQSNALHELLARIRHRGTVYEQWGFADKVGKGLGVTALFSGPPGTGKSMAAGLLAKDLGLELYQVDLSKVVSKWIGETERNLASLFDAAESSHAILLFDEADALFGKRTEVKGSNDRHANQQVNYLLQRLESFTGVCFLTSNHESAMDEAFRRRLSIHVRFPLPEAAERKVLWERMLPVKAPVAANLDVETLAHMFEMSGGYIRNAVLRAAFLAADTTGTIDSRLLLHAAHLEYEALGKISGRADVLHTNSHSS